MSSERTHQTSLSTIVVFENQRSYVDALRLALDITEDLRVVAAEGEVDEGLTRIAEVDPTIVVTACQFGSGSNAFDVIENLRSPESVSRHNRNVPVVILTSYPTPGIAKAAQHWPMVSVISKHRPITDVVRGMRRAVQGEEVYLGVADDPYGLSPAEFEVLELLVRGHNAAVIADELHLSVHAIRARIRGLLTKTDSASQLESVSKAIGAGVVAPPPLIPT